MIATIKRKIEVVHLEIISSHCDFLGELSQLVVKVHAFSLVIEVVVEASCVDKDFNDLKVDGLYSSQFLEPPTPS
jgi:hypothetical protein